MSQTHVLRFQSAVSSTTLAENALHSRLDGSGAMRSVALKSQLIAQTTTHVETAFAQTDKHGVLKPKDVLSSPNAVQLTTDVALAKHSNQDSHFALLIRNATEYLLTVNCTTTAVTADAVTDSLFAQPLEHALPSQFVASETAISVEVASLLADHGCTARTPKNADKSTATVPTTMTDAEIAFVLSDSNGVKETEDVLSESTVHLVQLTTDADHVFATVRTLCTVPTQTRA